MSKVQKSAYWVVERRLAWKIAAVLGLLVWGLGFLIGFTIALAMY